MLSKLLTSPQPMTVGFSYNVPIGGGKARPAASGVESRYLDPADAKDSDDRVAVRIDEILKCLDHLRVKALEPGVLSGSSARAQVKTAIDRILEYFELLGPGDDGPTLRRGRDATELRAPIALCPHSEGCGAYTVLSKAPCAYTQPG